MRHCAWKVSVVVFCLVVGLAGLAPFSKAESNYEYAKELLKNEHGLEAGDLVERLLAQLQNDPAKQTEAKAIKETLRHHQAEKTSLTKRKELLEEALALCNELDAGPDISPFHAIAETDSALLSKELLVTKISLAGANPAERLKLGHEAAELMERIATNHQALAVAAQAKFTPCWERYAHHLEQHPDVPVPREILEPLNKSFREWMTADQRYVSAKVEQLDCYDNADADKQKLAAILLPHCGEILKHDALQDWPVFSAWYIFMQVRICAIMGDEEKARQVMEDEDALKGNLDNDQMKQLFQIKKMILRELVTLKFKAQKYDDVVNILDKVISDPDWHQVFEEDIGKSLLIDYAKALTLIKDAGAAEYERALGKLQGRVEKEKSHWAADFSLAMAEILSTAHARNIQPRLTPREWYSAARGCMLLSEDAYTYFTELERDRKPEAQAQFEKVYRQHQDAVECYRQAVNAVKGAQAAPLTRLAVEAEARYEMGACYLRMRDYQEAMVAFQAVRDTFSPSARAKWTNLKPPFAPELRQALDETGKLLQKNSESLRFAIRQNLRHHPHDPPPDEPAATETPDSESEFLAARNALDAGQRLAGEAAEDEQSFKRAAELYLQAAEKFLKVSGSSSQYETALYSAASAYFLIHDLWSSGRFASRSAGEQARQARALAGQALEIFQRYNEYIKNNPPANDVDAQNRPERESNMLLARSGLFYSTQEWEKAIEADDEYIKRCGQAGRAPSPAALLNRFRARLEEAAQAQPPQDAPLLEDARNTMRQLRAQKPDEVKLYSFMLNALLHKFQRERLPADAAENKAAAQNCEARITELLEERFELLRKTEPDKLTLEEYTNLFLHLSDAGRQLQAVDFGGALLEKFDPKNTNTRLPDEPAFWQGLLAKMIGDPEKRIAGVLKYDALAKWDQCKQEHRILVDYMYDTREGLQYPANDPRRPAFDKLNADLKKAGEQLQRIKKLYPGCQTLNPKLGENGKAFLTLIEEEIDFRLRLGATRDLLLEFALNLAEKLQNSDPPAARACRQAAKEQSKIIITLKGDDTALELKIAQLHLLDEEYEAACKMLLEIKATVAPDSDHYFEASKLFSLARAKQKRWHEAAEYPEFLKVMGCNVEKQWPEMNEFLEECHRYTESKK